MEKNMKLLLLLQLDNLLMEQRYTIISQVMLFFMAEGKDVSEGWKEILLLMLGGFVGSFAKVIDFWFNNQENDNKLLEHADD